MRKLILRCPLSPGDIVVMTAAVRDLHRTYPGRFLTDVRTSCPELWENNPFLTPLREGSRGVAIIDLKCPLIRRSNKVPFHYLHSYIEFLNNRLGLEIKPTLFRGDIYLSRSERDWASQVYELAETELPFWIVNAGGKHDATTKWWPHARYQEVVDYFRGRIQFVQVGEAGHHHQPLRGVIDLRGRTALRQLVRLVHHSSGVLCGVTALMHLAAAVETKDDPAYSRACVVVAGGREPVHWEAYPGHQFLAVNGLLPCCSGGGCWKSRTVPLGDGARGDHPRNLCVDVVNGRPHCMDLIRSEDVIRRIEGYFEAGLQKYMTKRESSAGIKAMNATRRNEFDDLPLTLSDARLACAEFLSRAASRPRRCRGRGIVIHVENPGGLARARGCVEILRAFGCSLEIEIWHAAKSPMVPAEMRGLSNTQLRSVSMNPRDCRFGGARRADQSGWAVALLNSPYRETLHLSASTVPLLNPEYLFESREFRATGALFWPGSRRNRAASPIWQSCDLERPDEADLVALPVLIDQRRCWRALQLARWFGEHADFYGRFLQGPGEYMQLAFHHVEKSYGLASSHRAKSRGVDLFRDTRRRGIFRRQKNG